MGKLDGKIAIVTGASKGIGAAIAKAFGAAGATVVVNYATSKEGADRVVSAIISSGSIAIPVQADVSKPNDVKRLFEHTLDAFGKLDVLVNNAAVFSFGPLESMTEEEFHRQYNTNVLGLLVATQEAVKLFGAAGGSIINIGTAGTRTTRPHIALERGGRSEYTSTARPACPCPPLAYFKEKLAESVCKISRAHPETMRSDLARCAGIN